MSPSALVQDVCATCTQTFTDEDLTATKHWILPTILYLVVLFRARTIGKLQRRHSQPPLDASSPSCRGSPLVHLVSDAIKCQETVSTQTRLPTSSNMEHPSFLPMSVNRFDRQILSISHSWFSIRATMVTPLSD